MPFITDREQASDAINRLIRSKASMAIFCTASHWNVEAILRAADKFAADHNIKDIPVAVAMTSHYQYMQQAKRVTRSGNHKIGIMAVMQYCKLLCDGPDAPYANVCVLPHLDHADPIKDRWELTEGLDYFASVMFDMQQYPIEEKMEATAKYVKEYGHRVLVEGALESLGVSGAKESHQVDNYVEKAVEFVKRTKVDFLVADLGTEQQSTSTGKVYLKKRAQELTANLGRPMLVLHGTSSLKDEDIRGFSEDGVVRVNMWTRIVREAGKKAAKSLCARMDAIEANDFEACEARQYIEDNIDHAADIMYDILSSLNYAALSEKCR
ncbi:MAG TPA: class II fructose-bisphosphate aldolase [Clostridiaceae bacterium]|nr:class II fructose-bisphosphate aldolase [Clostridiaceae bacterium]